MEPKTILIIDDVSYVRLLFKNALEINGYKIFQANSGLEGLKIYTKLKIDLILLDLMLGDMTGVDFLEKMRIFEKNNDISEVPVLMITAFNYEQKINEAIQLGIINILFKPINVKLLINEIITCFEGRKPLKEKADKLILIVDPEYRSRERMEDALKKERYTCIVASSGQEALEILKRHRPDITLINPNLKDINGLYLFKGMIKLREETNLLALLNNADADLVSKLSSIGVDDILLKPINTVEFLDKVASIIKERELINTFEVSKDLFNMGNYDFGSLELLSDI